MLGFEGAERDMICFVSGISILVLARSSNARWMFCVHGDVSQVDVCMCVRRCELCTTLGNRGGKVVLLRDCACVCVCVCVCVVVYEHAHLVSLCV